MGLFDYLNIANEGDDNVSSFNDDDHNNMDFGKLFKEKGIFGALEGINQDREKAYEDEVKNTKFEKARSFFGSLATLGGQMIASGMGARRFNPIQDQVPQYNERLQRLRDAKRAEDAESNNKSLSMMVREFDQKREDEWRDRHLGGAAKRDIYKADRDKAYDDHRKEALDETKRHNKAMEGASMTRALRPVGGSGGSKKTTKPVAPKEDYVNVYDDDGNLKRVPARLITANDYWKYAKNSLVRDGKLKSTASDHELYKVMKGGEVYSNPVLKELNSKVGSRLFSNESEPARSKKTIPGFGVDNQGLKKVDGF